MMEFTVVGTSQLMLMVLGLVIWLAVPVGIAVCWKIKKKERFTTILVGAATFLLFALIIEKPIQNAIIMPDHAVSRFIYDRPLLWAFVVGLFPGVFEETGRLVAFKTVLRKRKNKETAISHGIGHGGFEVMLLLGLTYFEYIIYAMMINTGTFGTVVKQVQAQAPDQVQALYSLADMLASFSFSGFAWAVVERVFTVLFHTGASILVFYACKDKKKFWLYPLAVLIHTLLDFGAGLSAVNLFNPPTWVMEAIVGAFGLLTFFGAYFLLYRKDKKVEEIVSQT